VGIVRRKPHVAVLLRNGEKLIAEPKELIRIVKKEER